MGQDKPMDTEGSGGTGSCSDVARGHGSHRPMAGVDTRENRRNHPKWCTRQVAVEKKKEKFFGHGHIAVYEHGGKTGMAMLKYPHIKKNAQAQNSHPIPAS